MLINYLMIGLCTTTIAVNSPFPFLMLWTITNSMTLNKFTLIF